MDHAARRPLLAAATLATAGALAVTPITVASHEVHLPSISPAVVSTQAVQLTDAWSQLASDTVNSVVGLASTFAGTNNTLPSPTIFVAPILTQLVLNQLIYAGQLFRGQGGQIPGEIATHLNNLATIAGQIGTALPDLIVGTLQTPIIALQQAINSISTATNPLIGLLEAPAVFLDIAINSQFGFLGPDGPIGFPLLVRNAVAKAIDPPLPGWLAHILQPGKAPGAGVTLKVPAHAASSARSKAKAPASSHHGTASAKSTNGGGHSKRG